MSRSYVKMGYLAEEVFRRKAAGETNREICNRFGLTKRQVEQLINRQNRKRRLIENGYTPRPKGRPRKDSADESICQQTLSEFPSELVKTITCNRGTEFANWAEIEQALNCDIYFADPYCAWQKGSNENSNGLLIEFYPKGRNLSRVSPATLKRNLVLTNARFRKFLNSVSAQHLWDLELQNVLHLV